MLAGNVGGALDAVVDGETGPAGRPDRPRRRRASAATELLLDRELARRLGERAPERARSFAWPRICERVEALLLEQLGEARAA